jgi:parallel beta-helix repeat protein
VRHAALIVTVAASVLAVAPSAEAARAQHCGMRIKHSFTLHRNLHNRRGDGLVVAANNITIKLAGHVVDGAGVTIEGNNVSSSVHDGIDIDGTDVLVRNNVATGNGDDGIRTSHTAARVTLIGNITSGNADLGIQTASGTAIDGGGNQASGNVDPRQCLRVSCSP